MKPNVWAVVLNHRNAAETLQCVQALKKVRYRSLEIRIVENGSGDDEIDRLGNAATIIESGANRGYAGGNNVGILAALDGGAEAVWLLNPDAVPRRRALPRMIRSMNSDPRIGIVGCRLLEGGAPYPTVQSDGGRIVWEKGARSELIGHGEWSRRRGRGGVQDVDFVPGASMLIRRGLIEEIGLLPEEYFMYFEETEFCVLAKKADWRIVVDPTAEVVHDSGRSEGLLGETFLYYFIRNRILFGRRHTSATFAELSADLVPFIEGWRNRVEAVDFGFLRRFEQLVRWALADAEAGRTGRRDDIGSD